MKNNEKFNRIRPLKIWEILQRETDEDHPMGTEELRAKLMECGIEAHRTTIYEDIKLLNESGYEIMSRRGRSNQYYVMDRKFSNPEIHILLDAVQAASFITDKKTGELVDKIAQLAGSQKGMVLKKNIVQFNTAKSSNEGIYYNVNEIVTAINQRQKIIFLYFDYDNNHNRVYRKGGHHYVVSPYATVFDDGHYYLVIYDKRYNKMTNYRIDRMDKVEIIEELADMPPEEMQFDIATYKKSLFGMFSGKNENVKLRCKNHLAGAVIDRFGKDIIIVSGGEEYFTVTVDVVPSPQFFAWVFGFEGEMEIVSPAAVKDKMADMLRGALEFYEGGEQ